MTEVTVTSTPYEVSVSDDGSLITVASTGPAGPSGSAFTPAADSGSGSSVSSSLTIAGTAPISTSVSGTTVTVVHDPKGSTGTAVNYPGSITVDNFGHVVASGSTSTPLLPANNLSDVTASTARTNLELGTAAILSTGIAVNNVPKFVSGVADDDFLRVIGTAVEGRSAAELLSDIGAQAVDADLTAIAGLTSAADKGIQFTGSGSAAVYDLTAAGKALLDDADAAAQRTTLGLGTAATSASGDFAAAAHNQSATTITSGTLAVARGGTGVTSLPMVTIPGAADAAAARVVLGVTNVGSYTGQIETVADKTYTLDPGAATARTISGFFIKSASGTVTAALKVGTAVVKSASVTDSTGDQTSLANTGVSANDVLTLVTSSNSSALDVIFAVEYTE